MPYLQFKTEMKVPSLSHLPGPFPSSHHSFPHGSRPIGFLQSTSSTGSHLKMIKGSEIKAFGTVFSRATGNAATKYKIQASCDSSPRLLKAWSPAHGVLWGILKCCPSGRKLGHWCALKQVLGPCPIFSFGFPYHYSLSSFALFTMYPITMFCIVTGPGQQGQVTMTTSENMSHNNPVFLISSLFQVFCHTEEKPISTECLRNHRARSMKKDGE